MSVPHYDAGPVEPEPAPVRLATDIQIDAPVRPSPPLRRILLGVDLLAVAAGWSATMLTLWSIGDPRFGPMTMLVQSGFVLAAGAILISGAGLYRRSICAIRSQEVARTARVSMALALTAMVILSSVGREAALLAGFVGGVVWFTLLVVERGLFREWIQARRAGGQFGAPVVVVGGDSDSTLETVGFLAANPVLGFEVRGIVSPLPADPDYREVAWLGPVAELELHVRRARASGVVLDSSSMTGKELSDIVQLVTPMNLHIHVSSGLRGIDRRRISVAPMADETFLHVAPMGLSRRQEVTKRLVDLTIGSLALLLFAPVLLVCAVIIWLYDRGPVVFRQKRVGLNGEMFTLYKLRTMVVDAERRRAELVEQNARHGPLFKVARDPRITPFGRFLRAASLDEVPQLFNVLEGTMSLVGPRPALPEEVASFDEELNARLTVKPGVTGLWQVEARDLPSFDLYRRYDLLYVQNWSVGLDLAVIARTAAVVAMRALTAILPSRRTAAASVLE